MKNTLTSSVRRELAARQETTTNSQGPAKSTETDQNRLFNWLICSFIVAVAVTVTIWVIVAPSNSY